MSDLLTPKEGKYGTNSKKQEHNYDMLIQCMVDHGISYRYESSI
jgi:hypothetical protein